MNVFGVIRCAIQSLRNVCARKQRLRLRRERGTSNINILVPVAAQKRGNAKSGGKNRGARAKKAKKDFASVALEDDGKSFEHDDLAVVTAAQKSSHNRQESFSRHVSGDVHYRGDVRRRTGRMAKGL